MAEELAARSTDPTPGLHKQRNGKFGFGCGPDCLKG
jgi:hypothetical protein